MSGSAVLYAVLGGITLLALSACAYDPHYHPLAAHSYNYVEPAQYPDPNWRYYHNYDWGYMHPDANYRYNRD